jgi:hypothetical protein
VPEDFTFGQLADGVGAGLVPVAVDVGVPEALGVGVGVAVVGAGIGVTDAVGRPSRCTGALTALAHTASAATRAIASTTEDTTSGFSRRRPETSAAADALIVVQRLDGVGSVTPPD